MWSRRWLMREKVVSNWIEGKAAGESLGGLFLWLGVFFVAGDSWVVGSGRDMLRVRKHFEPLIK